MLPFEGNEVYRDWTYGRQQSDADSANSKTITAGSHGMLLGVHVTFDGTPTGGYWTLSIAGTVVQRFDRTAAGEGITHWFKIPAEDAAKLDVPALGSGVKSTINWQYYNL